MIDLKLFRLMKLSLLLFLRSSRSWALIQARWVSFLLIIVGSLPYVIRLEQKWWAKEKRTLKLGGFEKSPMNVLLEKKWKVGRQELKSETIWGILVNCKGDLVKISTLESVNHNQILNTLNVITFRSTHMEEQFHWVIQLG